MKTRAFRPCGEVCEDRSLATAGAAAALSGLGARAEALRDHLAARHEAALAWRAEVASVRADRAAVHTDGTVAVLGGGRGHRSGPPPIGPGLGRGLVRLALPLSYLDYGVITVWNNTFSTVNFGVSASSFAGGKSFPFSLPSGQFRSFYAPVISGFEPVFQVTLDPSRGPITVPQINVVFEEPAYLPPGKAGRPYAINFGVNGLYLSYI